MKYFNKFLDLINNLFKDHHNIVIDPEKLNGKYIEKADNIKIEKWFKNGVLHREDGPAFIQKMGIHHTVTKWYKDGKLHRENGPAMITKDGIYNWTNEWYMNNELHRDNDLPAIENASNEKYWYQHGKLHRKNNPAVIQGNFEQWWKYGKLHNENGPAQIILDFNTLKIIKKWFIDGNEIQEENFNNLILYKDLEKEISIKTEYKIIKKNKI